MQDAQKSATYENEPDAGPESELDEPRWSVVSFERCEASHLTFADARKKLAELEAAKIAGLCVVTDDVAERVAGPKA
ncbi:MAG: hypothetical protein ABI791_13935 [Acidobacteriota bacterium]